MIDQGRLLSLVDDARRRGEYPAGAERLNGKTQGEFELDLGGFRELVGAIAQEQFPFSELVPGYDGPMAHYRSFELFARAAFAAGARAHAGDPEATGPVSVGGGLTEWAGDVVVNGDLVLGRGGATLIVEGVLHVRGDVALHDGAQLVGLSRVIVDGDWRAQPWAVAAMCGDVAIAGAAVMGGETYVGGRLAVPVVYVQLDDVVGHLKVLGGADVRVLIEDPREGFACSEIYGRSQVDLVIADFDVVLDRSPRPTEEAGGRSATPAGLLVSDLADGTLCGRMLADELVRRIRAREPILAGDPSAGWLFR